MSPGPRMQMHHQLGRAESPGPGRAMSPGPRLQMPPSPMSMSRPPPSPARSATYDGMGQPPRALAQNEAQRPGSAGGRRMGPESTPHGLGMASNSGNLQRQTPQPVFHHPAQPQRPVIVDPSSPSLPHPHPLPPLPRTNSASPQFQAAEFVHSRTQSPTRSPMIGTSPNLPSPMSATFGHVDSLSPPTLAPRVPSPLASDSGPFPPPHGQYSGPSWPVTPKTPQFHGQAH